MSSEIAIDVRNLGIRFSSETASLRAEAARISRGLSRWREEIRNGNLWPKGDYFRDTGGNWVFKNVNFQVHKGEVFGIIGRNGCGKTTLLKILSRVLYPTDGEADIYGRVASLLAVGTGFHPAYTGRENIYFNGTILGLSKDEIDAKYDQIVEFSEIEDFIDAPVKTYSSGMQARLAFSVAAQLESDVLLLDEILSVGDAGFREKCMHHMHMMKTHGRTIVLVSHNMGVMESFCDRVMLIQGGECRAIGDPREVTQMYMESFRSNTDLMNVPMCERDDREGTGALRIVGHRIKNGAGSEIPKPHSGEDVVMCFEYDVPDGQPVKNVDFAIAFFSETGQKLVRFSTEVVNGTFAEIPSRGEFRLVIRRFPFVRGRYMVGFRAVVDGAVADYLPNAIMLDTAEGDFFGTGRWDQHSPIYVPHEWRVAESSINATGISEADIAVFSR